MNAHTLATRRSSWQRTGLALIFLWFALGGIAHFVFTAEEMRIVPPALPAPRALVLISGVCELLGALGIAWSRTRRAAGVGLLLLTIAVTPANWYMLEHAERFNIAHWVLVARLPLQAVLLALIAWCTWPRAVRAQTLHAVMP